MSLSQHDTSIQRRQELPCHRSVLQTPYSPRPLSYTSCASENKIKDCSREAQLHSLYDLSFHACGQLLPLNMSEGILLFLFRSITNNKHHLHATGDAITPAKCSPVHYPTEKALFNYILELDLKSNTGPLLVANSIRSFKQTRTSSHHHTSASKEQEESPCSVII